MKTFREFLSESQWMYHGSQKTGVSHLIPNRNEYMIDRAIGGHFAADPQISRKFARGLYNRTDKSVGTVYRTKAPPRSQLMVLPQKINKHGIRGSDQHSIESHVGHTVFSDPSNKELFKTYAMNSRMIDEPTAEKLHHHLMNHKSIDSPEFGMARQRGTSFHSFVDNYGGLNTNEGMRKEIVSRYLGIMRNKGIKGLVYHNTSPMETEGIPGDNPKFDNHRKPGQKGSRKSYVIFDPEEHKLEKYE